MKNNFDIFIQFWILFILHSAIRGALESSKLLQMNFYLNYRNVD